jgi:uncharacterized membrane protein YgcG
VKSSLFDHCPASRQAEPTADAETAPSGHRRRRWIAGGVVAVVAAAAVALAVTSPFRARASSDADGASYSTSTYTVTRQALTSQTQEDATLGDAGSYSVVNQAQGSAAGSGSGPAGSSGGGGASSGGTYTSLPEAGAVVRQGQALYAVSGTPVVLLYGSTPAYRDLAEGDTGADVTELNTDLVALGCVTAAELGARSGWDYYSAATASGVTQLQAGMGLTQTGSLDLGAAVFLPSAIEVTGYGSGVVLGGPADAGQVVLAASSTTPQVTIDLDASLQGEVLAGEQVGITLPDGSVTPGVVSSVSTVATSSSGGSGSGSGGPGGSGSSGGSATVTVEVSLADPAAAGSLNQAPVEVTITTGSVSNALVVPVDALLAETGGGYAVEVIGAAGRHRVVPVKVGLFDDAAGLVQVTGNLAAGQKVVVPAT